MVYDMFTCLARAAGVCGTSVHPTIQPSLHPRNKMCGLVHMWESREIGEHQVMGAPASHSISGPNVKPQSGHQEGAEVVGVYCLRVSFSNNPHHLCLETRYCNLECVSEQLKFYRHNYLFPHWGSHNQRVCVCVCNGFMALTPWHKHVMPIAQLGRGFSQGYGPAFINCG